MTDLKYAWSPDCQKAFERVKTIGGLLLQEDVFGIDKPKSFFSKKFNKHQLNYSVVEKEASALVWSSQQFEVYVGSGPVVVYTDRDPLTFLNSLHCPNQTLFRWSFSLQASSLDIRHFLVSVTLLIRFKVPVAELRPWCELEQVNCDQL